MEEYNIGFGRPNPNDDHLPLVIPKVGYDHAHTIRFRPNGFPSYQYLQCVRGNGFLEIYGEKYAVSAGTGFLLPPDVVHKYYSGCELWMLDWVEFSGSAFVSIKNGLKLPDFKVYENVNTGFIHHKIIEIVNIYKKKPKMKIMLASAVGYEILVQIAVNAQNEMRTKSKLTPVTDYINDNFSKPIELSQLAKIINVTPNYLCALFKKELGIRPIEYLNSVRINHAGHMLKEEYEMRISEIGRLCGFENDNYFREVFYKYFKTTPGKYRRMKNYSV